MSPKRSRPGRNGEGSANSPKGAGASGTKQPGAGDAKDRGAVAANDARTSEGEANDTVASRGVPMRAFSKSLPMELLRAREAVMKRFRPELRNHGVTEQQWRILRALAHAGPLEVSELAEATCLLAPSLSRILPDMEARQLIRRQQAHSDLRRSVISLERKGLRLIAMHAPNAERIYGEIAERFGPEKLAQLFGLLHELEQSLESEDDAPPTSRSRSKSRAPAARRIR
jgi:homoprotocatechuate degradation regulator HpaR